MKEVTHKKHFAKIAVGIETVGDHIEQVGTHHRDLIDDDQVGGFEDFFQIGKPFLGTFVMLGKLFKIRSDPEYKEAVYRKAPDIHRTHTGRAKCHYLLTPFAVVANDLIGDITLPYPRTAGKKYIGVFECLKHIGPVRHGLPFGLLCWCVLYCKMVWVFPHIPYLLQMPKKCSHISHLSAFARYNTYT